MERRDGHSLLAARHSLLHVGTARPFPNRQGGTADDAERSCRTGWRACRGAPVRGAVRRHSACLSPVRPDRGSRSPSPASAGVARSRSARPPAGSALAVGLAVRGRRARCSRWCLPFRPRGRQWSPRDRRRPATAAVWRPAGLVLAHATAAVAIGVIGIGTVAGFDPEALTTELTTALVDWAARVNPGPGDPPTAEASHRWSASMLCCCRRRRDSRHRDGGLGLYLGAKSVGFSGRLKRPVEPLWTITLPTAVPSGW